MSRYDWMGDALCAQTDPDLWHPESAGGGYANAEAVCGECPVRRQCADHATNLEGAISHPYRHGMWAGKAPRGRAGVGRSEPDHDAEVRRFTSLGLSAREIADRLGCTQRTVVRARARTTA